MDDFNLKQYKHAGHCIYCGEKNNLSREHIIPKALNGTAVIPKASCRNCADITKVFEGNVLRGPMWATRVFLGLKSRRKHSEAPASYPLTVIKNGQEQELNVPIERYPILLNFPEFSEPLFLSTSKDVKGINITGLRTISFGKRPEEILLEVGAQTIKITQNSRPTSFAKMIAKISYCMAYAEGLLDLIDGESVLLPEILGSQDSIGKWVGTIPDSTKKQADLFHRVSFHKDESKGLLLGQVDLFSNSQAPTYCAIIGFLK